MEVENDRVQAEQPAEGAAVTPPAEAPKKRRRGFAAMDPERVKAIASRGGVAVHARGTAHRFTNEEAREAGRKGGKAPHRVRGRKAAARPQNMTPSAT
jgi:general stress protein YciG